MYTSSAPAAGVGMQRASDVSKQGSAPQIIIQGPADSMVNVPGETNIFPIPQAMTQVVASAAGGGALSKTVYFGNEDTYNISPTDNGSGAGSIAKTYGDGWSGKGYNKLFVAAQGAQGVKCYGFTLQYALTADGTQNASALATATPTLLFANFVGQNQIPVGVVLSSGSRNTQYLAGEMTVKQIFYMNATAQLSYVVPVATTATLTVLTSPF